MYTRSLLAEEWFYNLVEHWTQN